MPQFATPASTANPDLRHIALYDSRDDLFASDGIHPGVAGAALYAGLIAAAVAAP